MKIKLKYCGFTTLEDIEYAIKIAVDYIGFIFHPSSHRYISSEKLASWKIQKTKTKKVGVFVNETIENIRKIFAQCQLDIVQLHGDETEEFCNQLNLPYWKVNRLDKKYNEKEINDYFQKFNHSQVFLLDKYHKKIYGGTGTEIDSKKVTPWLNSHQKIILAGGIKQENIQNFLSLKPYALDISSGIESEQNKKRKSHEKMQKIKKIVEKYNEMN